MKALIDRLRVPATESQLSMALALALVMMGLLLCAVIWQSNVIANQRDIIRSLWDMKNHGSPSYFRLPS